MPRGDAEHGTLLFEPKWYGYRCVAVRDDRGATLWSRQGKELTGYFPELCSAVAAAVPPGYVIDGEAVIWNQARLNFDALQQRLGTGPKTLPGPDTAAPANYVAFDVLAVAGHDARDLPLSDRRALLEEHATGWEPPLSLSPATTDGVVAQQWLDELPHTGIEGLVIKRTNQPYPPGVRSWLKLKHKDVWDVVCAAVIGSAAQPQAIIADLPMVGDLKIVGRSTVLSTRAGRELGPMVLSGSG